MRRFFAAIDDDDRGMSGFETGETRKYRMRRGTRQRVLPFHKGTPRRALPAEVTYSIADRYGNVKLLQPP